MTKQKYKSPPKKLKPPTTASRRARTTKEVLKKINKPRKKK